MREQRIVLHIGTHKTGSTALQYCLYSNRKLLSEKGILYPETGLFRFGQHECARCLGVKGAAGPPRSDRDSIYEDLRKELVRFSGHTVVMSAESFFTIPGSSVDFLKRFFSDFHVTVIVYLRRQDSLFESIYNQKAKSPFNQFKKPIKLFFDDHALLYPSFDYYESCRPWLEAFGKENLILRDYHNLTAGDVVADFLASVALQVELGGGRKKLNPSVSLKTVKYMLMAKRMHLPVFLRRRFFSVLNRLLKAEPGESFLYPDEAERIYKSYELSNRRLADEFGRPADFLRGWSNIALVERKIIIR